MCRSVGESCSVCNSHNLFCKKSFLGESTKTKPFASKNSAALIRHQSWIPKILFYPSSTEGGLVICLSTEPSAVGLIVIFGALPWALASGGTAAAPALCSHLRGIYACAHCTERTKLWNPAQIWVSVKEELEKPNSKPEHLCGEVLWLVLGFFRRWESYCIFPSYSRA